MYNVEAAEQFSNKQTEATEWWPSVHVYNGFCQHKVAAKESVLVQPVFMQSGGQCSKWGNAVNGALCTQQG